MARPIPYQAIPRQPEPAPADPSLLQSVGSGTLSLLAGAGNFLDTLGSGVRDTLAGENPFDNQLFTADNRLTGRDLGRRWGLFGDKDTWANFAGGLGIEIATDPLTYTPLMPFRVAGKIASKAGVLDDFLRAKTLPRAIGAKSPIGRRELLMRSTLGDVIQHAPESFDDIYRALPPGTRLRDVAGQTLGGAIGFGLPFRDPSIILGNADGIGGRVARALDKVGERARWGLAGRVANAAFNPDVKGALSRPEQELAQAASIAEREAQRKGRAAITDFVRQYHAMDDVSRENFDRVARAHLENVADQVDDLPDLPPEQMRMVEEMKSIMPERLMAEQAAGVKVSELMDGLAEYFPRYKYTFPETLTGFTETVKGAFRGRGSRAASAKFGSQKGREEFLKSIKGGTDTINRMSKDIEFSGIKARGIDGDEYKPGLDNRDAAEWWNDLENRFREKYGNELSHFSDEEVRSLLKWLAGLDPRHADEGVGVFGRSVVEDLFDRIEAGSAAEGTAKAITDFLKRSGGVISPEQTRLHDVSLREALEGIPLDADVIAKKLGAEDPAKLWVTGDVAEKINRIMTPFSGPDGLKPIIQAIDFFNSSFKANVTSIFPSFHVRNRLSGIVQNWLNDQWSLGSDKAANQIVLGKTPKGLAKSLNLSMSDEEAAKYVSDLAFEHNLLGGQGRQFEGAKGTFQQQMPGLEPFQGVLPTLKEGIPRSLQDINPLGVRGAMYEETVARPYKAGEEIGGYVEALNRLSPFIENLKRGYSPKEAAKRVKWAQVDYDSLSQFERGVMRRIFPFYSFSSRIAAWTVKELLDKPGGKLAHLVRAQTRATGNEPGMPDYVAQTTAIPMGDLGDGTQRYVTGLGLMHEDPFSFGSIRGGSVDVGDVGAELISRMNPLLKMGIEIPAGESFFQRGPMGGRELLDMDPTVGRLISNVSNLAGMGEIEDASGRALPLGIGGEGARTMEHVLANSPLSRALTTARAVTDTRKWGGPSPIPFVPPAITQLLTGVRVSDVSPAAREGVLREELSARARDLGAKMYQQVYFPKGMERNEEQQRIEETLRLLNQLAKQRKRAAG